MVSVLSLVSKRNSPPYRQQIAELERVGVDCTEVPVPSVDDVGDRGLRHYLQFYADTLAQAHESYDLVHANYGLTAPAAIAQPQRPVVISLWGTDLMGDFGWVSRWCARFADAIVVMSEEMADELTVPCHVIPHGVDTELFAPRDRRAAQADLGWDPDDKHVLFPYSPERTVKNYGRAARVVDQVDKQLTPTVKLQYTTGVDHDRMPVYMNAADALLLTSNREGSPNVVKEALACNLPVVSTDVGDVSDRLDGVSASAVGETDQELADKLGSILERNTHSDGREQIRHLASRNMTRRLRDVYVQVITDRPQDLHRPGDGWINTTETADKKEPQASSSHR